MLSRSIHRYAQQLSYTSGYLVMSHSHVSKSPTDTVLLGMNTTPYITAAFFLLVLTTYYDVRLISVHPACALIICAPDKQKSCGLSPLSKFTEDPLTFSSFDLAPFLIDTVLLARLTTWHSFNPHDFLSHLGPTVCIRAARLITSHAFYVVLHNSLTQKIDAHTSLIQTLIFIDSTLQLLDWTCVLYMFVVLKIDIHPVCHRYMSSKLLASLQTDINQYRWEIR
jgi:hypothetical protein